MEFAEPDTQKFLDLSLSEQKGLSFAQVKPDSSVLTSLLQGLVAQHPLNLFDWFSV